MHLPTDPLSLIFLYLRSILDAFSVGGIGLQLLGFHPNLLRFLRLSLFLGIFFLLFKFLPVNYVTHITLLHITIIVILMRTQKIGLFVSTAAVILGFNLISHIEWLFNIVWSSFGIQPVHILQNFSKSMILSAPSVIFLAGIVVLNSYLAKRERPGQLYTQIKSIFTSIDKDVYKRIIPTAQLFTVLIVSHVIIVFYWNHIPRWFVSTVPFLIHATIILAAYFREKYDSDISRSGFSALEFLDILTIFPYLHITLIISGGIHSSYKLLYIPLIIANALKMGRVAGILAVTMSCVSLATLGTVFNSEGQEWNVEIDLVYMGVFIFTYFFINYFSSEKNLLLNKLKMEAYTDDLTGLHNYRYFKNNLHTLLDKNLEHVYLLLIDLDNFKFVNDTFGHLAGDNLLKRISDVIRKNTRREDLVARYGGDEFLIILSNQISGNEAIILGERIRKDVEITAAAFLSEHSKDIFHTKVSASIGICRTHHLSSHKNQLLRVADQSLNKAKRQGKNQIVFIDLDTGEEQVIGR